MEVAIQPSNVQEQDMSFQRSWSFLWHVTIKECAQSSSQRRELKIRITISSPMMEMICTVLSWESAWLLGSMHLGDRCRSNACARPRLLDGLGERPLRG